jgi:hypothetical protein
MAPIITPAPDNSSPAVPVLATGNTSVPIMPTRGDIGALAAPPDISDPSASGADLSAANPNPVPPLTSQIAQSTQNALTKVQGKPGDWAKATLAGIQTALSGFGAAGQVPKGAGAAYGIGAAAREMEASSQKKQELADEKDFRNKQLGLEQQKVTNEQSNFDKDFQLKTAENARQQAESIKRMAVDDANLANMGDEHNLRNFELMKAHIDFANEEVEREDTLKRLGAKPLTIAGAETPSFNDLGDLENYATKNHLEDLHLNGYRTRPVYGADRKYHLMEVPDDGVKEYKLKDATGTERTMFGTSTDILAQEEKIAQTKDANAKATLDYAQASKALSDFKEGETAKKARAELTKNGGDYSKLSPGAKDALLGDSERRFSLTMSAYQSAEKDMEKDTDYGMLPTDAKGNVDTNSPEYQALANKYHVSDANAALGDSYQELRQLGIGYKQYGGTPPPATTQQASNLTPAQQGFQKDQSDQVAAKQKAEADKQKKYNEREADPISIPGMGPNPNYDDAEKYLGEHPELSPAARGEVRDLYQKQKNGGTQAPATAGAPQKGTTRSYNGANYAFDGQQWVKQ